MKETPSQYLDYLTSEVKDAKTKALSWLQPALVSHLCHRFTYLTREAAVLEVLNWAWVATYQKVTK